MNIVSSVVRSSTPVAGDRVERDVTVEVRALSVAQAEDEALSRFGRENPAATLEILSHTVLKRPRQGVTWTESGIYHVTLRARGLLENLV